MCGLDVIYGSYKYWRCKSCGLSQVIPQPLDQELSSYYDKFHLSDSEGGIYDEFEQRMQADFPKKVSLIKKFLNAKNFKLLDVGCGKGFFVSQAKKNNIEAIGLDASKNAIKFALQNLRVNAQCGKIESKTKEWEGRFDAVTLWATIEHLKDPVLTISSINRCLKPGGYLFLDTGLGGLSIEKFLAGYNQWYDAPQHLFVFSEKSLVNILKSNGFSIVKIDNNFDRSVARKLARLVRHYLISLMGILVLRPILGRKGFSKMKLEAKWPIGRLISVVARKEI